MPKNEIKSQKDRTEEVSHLGNKVTSVESCTRMTPHHHHHHHHHRHHHHHHHSIITVIILLFLLVVAITMTASSMLNILVPRTTVTLGSWTRARSQPETKIALGPRCHGTAGRLLFVIHNNNAYGSALRTPNTTPVHNDYFDGYINYALAKLQKWWWFGCVKSHALFEDDEPWQLLFKPLIHNHVSG